MKRWIPFLKTGPLVSVVRLQGSISNSSRGLDDISLGPVIEKAFSRGKPAAVALEINSPGGSAVQSSLIAARIRRLAEEKGVPVYAFVEDVAASGGYWLACSGDEIYVDRGSIIGSIGVISANFGAHELLGKIGVERRIYTAGKSKSMLDPFAPEKAADVKRLKIILEDLHGYFIDWVQSRRGGKLAEGADLFTGEIWVGQKGVDVGLADGIGQLVPTMKKKFGKDVKFRRYGQKLSIAQRLGARIAGDAIGAVEERADFARFGL